MLAANFSLVLVYAAVLVDGTLMLSARGLSRSAINIVLKPSGKLREGNGLLNIGLAIAGVLGVATGGALVGEVGPATVLAIDAASFAMVGLIAATLPHVEWIHGDEDTLMARLRGGLGWAWSQKTIRMLIAGEALAIVFFTLIVPIEVVYAKETLSTSDAGYGVFLASWSLGQILGGLLYVGMKVLPARAAILVSTAIIGVGYLGIAATDQLWVACAFALVGGIGNGVQWVAVLTLVQQWTPDGLQARITGLLESAASFATGAGFIVGGVLVALFSPPLAFTVAGIGALLIPLAALLAGAEIDEPPQMSGVTGSPKN